MLDRLYYVADPMCSWCWGFAPVLEELRAALPDVELTWVMGGLAPDSEEPMPDETRRYVQDAWRQVAATTGASFNFEFWEKCAPRRSTYPACRAVIAAGERGPEMFAAIQRAYYAEARNPSDTSTLVELAVELGLDGESFAGRLEAPETQARLEADFALRSELGVNGFPSLIAERHGRRELLMRGYSPAAPLLATLQTA